MTNALDDVIPESQLKMKAVKEFMALKMAQFVLVKVEREPLKSCATAMLRLEHSKEHNNLVGSLELVGYITDEAFELPVGANVDVNYLDRVGETIRSYSLRVIDPGVMNVELGVEDTTPIPTPIRKVKLGVEYR